MCKTCTAGQLAQPGSRRLGVDRAQQGQRVAAVELGEPITLGRRGGQPPGIDPGPVAGAPLADLDHAGQPVRGRGREGFQTGPHRLPGQLQPVEITHRRGHVGGIGALLAAGPDQALGRQHLQHLVEHHLFQTVFDQPGAELAQHARVEAGIGQFQPEGVLPVDRARHHQPGLAIGQVLHVLQHRDQRQRPRRLRRSAPRTERSRELLITKDVRELVARAHRRAALRKRRPGHHHRLVGNTRRWPRPHRHHAPHSAAGNGEQRPQARSFRLAW